MSVDDIFFIYVIRSPPCLTFCLYQLDEKVHISIDFGQGSNISDQKMIVFTKAQ